MKKMFFFIINNKLDTNLIHTLIFTHNSTNRIEKNKTMTEKFNVSQSVNGVTENGDQLVINTII